MRLDLDSEGNPKSAFVGSLVGRNIDLMAEQTSSHPRQIIGPKAAAVARGVEKVIAQLDALPRGDSMPLDASNLCEDFRRLIYDATELFDVYAQLLPERLDNVGKNTKSALGSYKTATKRLRDPWALLCNKCKHGGSSLAYNRAVATVGHYVSHGYIVLSPKHGTAMLRDEQVHKGGEQRATFTRKLHEMIHAILRTDLNAAKLVSALPDGLGHAIPVHEMTYPFGRSLQLLHSAHVSVAAEPRVFDGVRLPGDGTVELVRAHADAVIGDFTGTTQFTGDGHSTTYSFT